MRRPLAQVGLLACVLSLSSVAPAQAPVPVVDADDYVYCYWPTNFRPWPLWPGYQKVRYVNSGSYGLCFDTASADVVRMGRPAIPAGGAVGALQLDNAALDALPGASVSYDVVLGGAVHAANSFQGSGGNANIPGRVIDGGRFMHRLDVPNVGYSGAAALAGSVVLAAMPRHFALTQRVTVPAGAAAPVDVRIHFDGAALTALGTVEPLAQGRGVKVTDATGEGWVFLVPEVAGGVASVAVQPSGAMTATQSYAAPAVGAEVSVSVIAMRTEGLSAAQLDAYVDPGANVTVRYAQQDRQGQLVAPLAVAAFDPERGAYLVDLELLTNVGAPTWPTWSDPVHQTWYNRHRLVLESAAAEPVVIPLALDLEADVIASITGGCAMLRDSDGEPLGVPVQISKNWHETTSPRRWYHFYSAPLLPAGGTHELEFTIARAKWGSCFAASHAQLSLIGYGTDQQWDESALGCWGESITYDPDLTLQRSMLDDVRPFLVQSQNQYNWTGNVGGADFFTYRAPNGYRDRLGRMRSHYAAQGPNLTDVTYAGRTWNGKVSAKVRTRLGRTDDVVRAYYDLEYTFHDAVSYDRLAFFQVAADNYSDNDFQRLATGNAAGVVTDVAAAPTGVVGYATPSDRGIALPGEAPWVLLYDNAKIDALREDVACVGFVVREYEFTAPGAPTVTTPHVNMVNTNNWSQYPEVGFELGIPYNAASATVPAGAVLRAKVEYLVLPDDKSLYYGPSADLLALPASLFTGPELIRTLAAENRLDVQATVGVVTGTHPIEIDCDPTGAVAAEFSVAGGFGYVPIVLRGLDRHDGWRLQRNVAGVWSDLGQEVEGNDYWQCRYDAVAGSYELTFNVDNDGTMAYRLSRGGPAAAATLAGAGCPAAAPLTLTSSAPVVGGEWALTASPVTSPACLFWFGDTLFTPGVDLSFLGAPGCAAYTNANLGVVVELSQAGTSTYTLPLPNVPGFLGQSFAVQASAGSSAVPVGFVTSNGVLGQLGL